MGEKETKREELTVEVHTEIHSVGDAFEINMRWLEWEQVKSVIECLRSKFNVELDGNVDLTELK